MRIEWKIIILMEEAYWKRNVPSVFVGDICSKKYLANYTQNNHR